MSNANVQYDNNNTGALFSNTQRLKDTHPNSKGRAEINGIHMWIASWTKTSAAGQKFMSLAFTPLTDAEVAKYVTPKPQATVTPIVAPIATNDDLL